MKSIREKLELMIEAAKMPESDFARMFPETLASAELALTDAESNLESVDVRRFKRGDLVLLDCSLTNGFGYKLGIVGTVTAKAVNAEYVGGRSDVCNYCGTSYPHSAVYHLSEAGELKL